jgi:hypothetical protein
MIQEIRKASSETTSRVRLKLRSEKSAVSYMVRGELAFLFFLGLSVALHPGFVLASDEGGMSNYGLHIKTAVPYTLAIGLLALCNRHAASLSIGDDRRSRRLRFLLRSYCAVLLSVLLSTYFYSLNIGLKDLHFALGTLLIVLVGFGSLWMYQLWRATVRMSLLLLVQLSGDTLALLTVFGVVHVLFLAEMLSNIGFAILLIRTGRRIALEEQRTNDAVSFS